MHHDAPLIYEIVNFKVKNDNFLDKVVLYGYYLYICFYKRAQIFNRERG